MGVANILIEKPSRIHNLSYFVLGYYLMTLLSFEVDFSLSDRIFLITFFGGFVGTLIYYIKPIEKIITTYFKYTKKNKVMIPEEIKEFSIAVYKSEILFSKYFNDERIKINGAIFLGIGFLLSNSILNEYDLGFLYLYAVVFSLLLFVSGTWEIYFIIKRKMDILVFYYTFYNVSKKISDLSRALEAKDWIQAEKIAEGEWYLWEPDLYIEIFGEPIIKSLCPKCSEIREQKAGEYCIECGTKLIEKCSKCNNFISYSKGAPKYCSSCGFKFSEIIEKEKKG